MSSDISTKTKDFIRQVNALIDGGHVRNRQEIIDSLKWSKSYMSQVMSGEKNVPAHIYGKFKEVYQPLEVRSESSTLEISIQSYAMQRVILRSLAEILSKQRNESVTKTLSDLEAAVRVETTELAERLR